MKTCFAIVVCCLLALPGFGADRYLPWTFGGRIVGMEGASTSAPPVSPSIYASNSCVCYFPFNDANPFDDMSIGGTNDWVNGSGANALLPTNNTVYGVDDYGTIADTFDDDMSGRYSFSSATNRYESTISVWLLGTVQQKNLANPWSQDNNEVAIRISPSNTFTARTTYFTDYDASTDGLFPTAVVSVEDQTNAWHHFCVTTHGLHPDLEWTNCAETTMYLDGILQSTATSIRGWPVHTNMFIKQDGVTRIMSQATYASTRAFEGYMDDFAGFNNCLSSQEVYQLFLEGRSEMEYPSP